MRVMADAVFNITLCMREMFDVVCQFQTVHLRDILGLSYYQTERARDV